MCDHTCKKKPDAIQRMWKALIRHILVTALINGVIAWAMGYGSSPSATPTPTARPAPQISTSP